MAPSRLRRAGLLAAAAALAAACGDDEPAEAPAGGPPPAAEAPTPAPAAPRAPGDLVDEAAERGLAYVNVSGEPSKPTILEANGAGVALLDLGGDGDLDVAFGQGLPSLEALVAGPGARVEVFENDGAGRFERAPSPPGEGWWTGLAAGDVDNDGDDDLVAAAYGDLALFRQEDGRLVPAPGAGLLPPESEAPGARLVPGAEREAGAAPWWATSLALLDADLDGALDLYVGQYLELDPVDPPRGELGDGALALPCWWKGHEVYCGPRGMVPQPDRVLRNDGGGGFEDVSARWLGDHEPGYTLAVGVLDADFDGDPDLHVANDSSANLMLVNEVRGEAGAFVDHGLASGVALSPDGLAEAGMGVGVGDVDRDGRLDLAVTNFSDEPTHLYLGRERGFADATHRLGLAAETRRLLSWSAHLADLDGDGWLELFTTNGHVYPQADAPGTGTSYGQPDTLWRLLPGARAARVEPRSPRSLLAPAVGSRGSALGDVDGDGAPDLVVARLDAPAALGMNRLAPDARRLVVRCLGDPSRPGPDGRRTPADGTGAKLVLVPLLPPGAEEFALLGEVRRAEGYQSSSSPEVHFALGDLQRFAVLRVLWPSGRVDEIGPGAMGRRLVVREGRGVVEEVEL